MRSVIRKPSIKKSVSARTTGRVTRTVKKVSNPAYGKKGVGYIKDPKKAAYNKFYNETSYGIQDVVSHTSYPKTVSSSNTKSANQSDTFIISNQNLPDFIQKYPHLIKILRRQFVMRILSSVFLFPIALLCIFTAKYSFFFTLGLVLLGVSIYQLYKGNQYRNAYLDAKECMRKLHS